MVLSSAVFIHFLSLSFSLPAGVDEGRAKQVILDNMQFTR